MTPAGKTPMLDENTARPVRLEVTVLVAQPQPTQNTNTMQQEGPQPTVTAHEKVT